MVITLVLGQKLFATFLTRPYKFCGGVRESHRPFTSAHRTLICRRFEKTFNMEIIVALLT